MRKRRRSSQILAGAALLIPFVCSLPGVSGQATAPQLTNSVQYQIQGGHAMIFSLQSSAFVNGGGIPRKFTCDGADLSPALSWEGVPAGTHSLALIADDPDAPVGTWTHWVIWNIPAQAASLPEGVSKIEVLDNGARQGSNNFRRIGYGGPCPPPGRPHRYFFKLYALDAALSVKAGAKRSELELAMKGHLVSKAELMGTYGR